MNGSVCVCFLWLSVLNILRLFYLRSNPFLSISDSKFRSTPVPGSTVENVTYLNTVFILYYFYSSLILSLQTFFLVQETIATLHLNT